MYGPCHLSEAVGEVVLVVSDHRVPAVHQQTPLRSLPCPEHRQPIIFLKAEVQTGKGESTARIGCKIPQVPLQDTPPFSLDLSKSHRWLILISNKWVVTERSLHLCQTQAEQKTLCLPCEIGLQGSGPGVLFGTGVGVIRPCWGNNGYEWESLTQPDNWISVVVFAYRSCIFFQNPPVLQSAGPCEELLSSTDEQDIEYELI